MEIRRIYDPILRRPAQTVTVFDDELKKLSLRMLEIMHQNIGMGLAANQLGIDKDLLVIEFIPPKDEKGLKPIPALALCNARVLKTSQEKDRMSEGCLSVPKLELPVSRSTGVTVEAQTLDGKKITIKAKGLLARILQHEIDHLDGKLFTDRAEGLKNLRNYTWANIVFMGSDEFSQAIYQALRQAGLNVTAVICEADKEAGRGQKLTFPIMKTVATNDGIAVLQPSNKEEITAVLEQMKPDLVVLASYGKIVPAEALLLPIYGCLNVHPSLLPKYRGATPVQSAILAGDDQTGVTIMKMDPGVDTGSIVAQSSLNLAEADTYLSLREKLAKIGGELLIKALPLYLSGQAEPKLQTGEPTKTTKLTKEMGEIDWSQPPQTIHRRIRALNPWPGTHTTLGDKRLKILDADFIDNKLFLLTVQLEGKKAISWPEFKRGYFEQLKKSSWYGKIS